MKNWTSSVLISNEIVCRPLRLGSSWPGSTSSIMSSGVFSSPVMNLMALHDEYCFVLYNLSTSIICREHDFEDGNHFYRFLEHEPFIPRCINFRGSTTDSEPKSAAAVGQRIMKLMSAILESYTSDDRCHVDYMGISNSEEFRRYPHFPIPLICLYGLSSAFYFCYLLVIFYGWETVTLIMH